MTIAYAAPKEVPSRAANSVHFVRMCNAFANANASENADAFSGIANANAFGNNVTLIVPGNSKAAPDEVDIFKYYGIAESFSIVRINSLFSRIPKIRTIAYAYKTARYVSKNRFDCIYSRDMFVCFFLAAVFKKEFVLEFHEPIESKSVKGAIFRRIINTKYVRKLVVITGALKRDIIARYELDDGLIFVAPDGADLPPETTDSVSLAEDSKGKFQVGYIGHLYKGRGIELLGDMAAALPFAFFHIVGGTDKDIAYWKEKYRGIDNICFYGYVPPSQTVSYGTLMDALIAPYQSNLVTANGVNTVDCMSPLKIFEYMALGKPIISSDMPVLCEVLTDGVNGVLCPASDVNAWIAAIKKLYEDKAFAKKIAGNALGDLNEKYTWSARAGNILRELAVSS